MDYKSTIAQLSRYGDIVAAFCVLQSLAFAYKLGQTSDDVYKAIVSGGLPILWLILIAGLFYSALVYVCGYGEVRLRIAAKQEPTLVATARLIYWGRVAIVIFSTAIAAAGFILNLR